MDVDAMFPSRFIKAADLKGKPVTLTIESVELNELESDKGKEMKGVIAFVGAKKKWVLNRTNAKCLQAMWGRETDGWKGHRVTIYPTTFNDEPCIRVKGSPELEKPVEFELKLPKKRPKLTRLIPTGKEPDANVDIDKETE